MSVFLRTGGRGFEDVDTVPIRCTSNHIKLTLEPKQEPVTFLM